MLSRGLLYEAYVPLLRISLVEQGKEAGLIAENMLSVIEISAKQLGTDAVNELDAIKSLALCIVR
jgi:hypothetical protein